MDNQFENEYQNSQPQRPFNEKPEPQTRPVETQSEQKVQSAAFNFKSEPQAQQVQPAAFDFKSEPQTQQVQPPAFDFQPEKPLMQKPEPENRAAQPFNQPQDIQPEPAFTPQGQGAGEGYQAPAQQPYNQYPEQPRPFYGDYNQRFNPIEHTATYAGNRFVDRQDQATQPPYGGYPQPSVNYGDTRRLGYPYQPQPPQNDMVQPAFSQGGEYASMYERQPVAADRKPKTKANKGLVAVIIVLSVLLAASVGGIIFFMFNSNNSSQDKDSGRSNSNGIFDFTLPDGYDFTVPQTETKPQKEHKESDYSDKVIKDYKGLSLSDIPSDKNDAKYDSEYAYSKVSDSVVGIECFLDNSEEAVSEGTGTIITSDGYVLTNAHVIGNSKTMYSIKVTGTDNKKYDAGVVGFDSRTDLAVLKLDGAKDLKAVEFGDSDKLKVGENISIIGNPGGQEFKNSLTRGIVSALNRDASNKSIVKYIQTDAAINPGNSGGPAVNKYGQVVGIASAKIVDEKYEGMGFCIPSTTVKTIVDSLMKNGYVEGRVKIGISGYAVTQEMAAQYSVPAGIYAENVDKDGPCGKAGIAAGEIITEFDGEKIASFADIYNQLEKHKDGDKVKIKVYNDDDKKERETEITLQADK